MLLKTAQSSFTVSILNPYILLLQYQDDPHYSSPVSLTEYAPRTNVRKRQTAGTKGEYLEITGDLLPFTVFVLSQGFLVSSEKQSDKTINCLFLFTG